MNEKIEIRLYKIAGAGMFEIRTYDFGISPVMVLKMNPGSPFKYTYRDAERLSVILNCDLYLDDKLIRERIDD